MGKNTEPMKYYQHSLEILGTLVATYPKNNRYQHDLATAHDRVGIILQRSGDLKGAMEHFQQGLTIDKKLVERDRHNAPA
ncbi:MAG: hypothetical protein ACE5EQ_07735 [Phycisphaerae bacterium]